MSGINSEAHRKALEGLDAAVNGGRSPAAAIYEAERALAAAGLTAAAAAEEKPDPLNDELAAMRSVARTLEKLPRDVQDRVVTWLCARLPPRFAGLGDPVGR